MSEKDVCLIWDSAYESKNVLASSGNFIRQGAWLKIGRVSIVKSDLFLKKDPWGFLKMCTTSSLYRRKVVKSACIILAFYMRFNGIGI